MHSVTLPAYAKVNLYLDVLGVRPDGYHNLLTLFERIDLFDEVTIERIPGSAIEVRCDHPEVPLDETNSGVRAAAAYRKRIGSSDGIRISIRKGIPVAGGLGGGSSDAAATLHGLQELLGRVLPEVDLLDLAKGLGADVPFFWSQVPWALGSGRGDEIEPLPLQAAVWHLLVAPGFPIPTKAVYQAWAGFRNGGTERLTAPKPDVTLLIRALREAQMSGIRESLWNALEPTVEALYPAIRRVKAAMEAKAGVKCPIVSGSGSTVFALCASRTQALEAVPVLTGADPNWRVFVVETRV